MNFFNTFNQIKKNHPMEAIIALIIGIAFLVLFVIIMRLLGAWMLRINEIIKHQNTVIRQLNTIIEELKRKDVK